MTSAIAFVAAFLIATPVGGAMHWRSIGPAIGGGRTTSVAGSNDDALLYYFGAADGGVWKTTDGGATWSDVWGQMPVGSIGAVAVAPSDDDVVWVGTGEANSRNDTSYGEGVWVSHDAGRSWTHRGLDASMAISRILVAPHDPQTALVAATGDPYRDSTERGVFRTTDGGRSWTKTLYAGPSSGVSDMAADPSGQTVFAGVWQFRRKPWDFASGGTADGLYRSRDGGKTWHRLTGDGLPDGLMGRIGVAVSRGDPRVVYAVIQSRSGTLWRSDDGGDRWHRVNADTYANQRPFYMSHIAIDPLDEDHVIAESEDLVQSRDAGHHFENIAGALHQDHHDLWWSHDGKRLIEASDGGAAISVDGGETWLWGFNVPIGQVYHVGYDTANPYQICGGLQDNDAFCGPSDSLDPLGILDGHWRDVGNDGDGSWVWPDPTDARYIWNVGVNALNGQLGLYDTATRENIDVTPSLHDTNGAGLVGVTYRYNWQAPIAFSRGARPAAYYGANVVFRSYDRGRSWKAISPDLTLDDPRHQRPAGGPINTDISGAEFYDTIVDIAPSTVDANVIWVGTDDGLIQLTRDDGAHWSNVTMRGIGPYGRVECVEPSGFNAGAAFAVVDRHMMGDRRPYIYATDDFGATWHAITAGLPRDQYAHVVRQSHANPAVLFAGLEQGVWVTFDGGRSWSSLQQNMPTTAVDDLRIQPIADDLVAATHGRDFFILDDIGPLEQPTSVFRQNAYLFAPRPAYAFWRWWTYSFGSAAGECCVSTNRFSGENPEPGTLISYYLRKPLVQPPVVQILDGDGHVVRTLDAPATAGIDRVSWNLTESPPASWWSARPWNQGVTDGARVVPGTYLVRLRAGSTTIDEPLVVRPDPRSSWTQRDYAARYDFERRVLVQLNAIDLALNDLDRRASKRPLTHAERALFDQLTSDPRNNEDDMYRPDRLRERVQTLLLDVGFSAEPPTPGQRAEAADVATTYNEVMSRYRALPKR